MKKIGSFLFLTYLLIASVSMAQQSFKFTNKPSNEGCFMKGKSFTVEGNVIAEYGFDDGSSGKYFAVRKDDQVIVTCVSFNPEGEAKNISYYYLTKNYLEDTELSELNGGKELDLMNMYDKCKSEEIDHMSVKKKSSEVNGFNIRDFKSKKDLENFKKMLKF